jgi:hypothetical protein
VLECLRETVEHDTNPYIAKLSEPRRQREGESDEDYKYFQDQRREISRFFCCAILDVAKYAHRVACGVGSPYFRETDDEPRIEAGDGLMPPIAGLDIG